MKNITVTVSDETYHRSRVHAAELRTSLSALVKGFLEKMAGEETEMERLKRSEQEMIARIHKRLGRFCAGDRLKRDELYDRHALR
ncbi:MAG: hypothetical protein ACFCUX_10410 [Candidatus Methylacidiphilales bacterium]